MAPLLTLEDVSVGYRDGSHENRVLGNVSLDIEPGEMIGVWGTRRSGKTTLANVAAGCTRADSGLVMLGNQALPVPARLRRQRPHEDIALVHLGQTPKAPRGHRTVIDHLSRRVQSQRGARSYKRNARRAARRSAHEVLQRLGLLEYEHEPWERLAHRERVLIAVAEALISMPRLLILDDYGLGIDPMRLDRLHVGLRETTVAQNMSVLLTAESISSLMGVNRLGALTDGQLLWPEQADPQVIAFPTNKRSA
jgi:ABC-type multidrug transport system ATPase subunit